MEISKKNGNGHSDACQEKWGMMCSGDKHMFVRWIIGIIILTAIFCIGYNMGKFNGRVERGYGMYDSYQGYNMMGAYPSMMRSYQKGYINQYDGQAVPTSPDQQVTPQPNVNQLYTR